MQRLTLIIAIILISLTACAPAIALPTVAPSMTPAPAATVTPAPTEPPAATATAAEASEPAKEAAVVGDDLDWEYIETHRVEGLVALSELNGVQMDVDMGIDSSIKSLIQEARLHENWKSEDGNNAQEALPVLTQEMFYETWKLNQKTGKTGLEKTEFETWIGWVAEAQKTGTKEAWEKVSLTGWMNDMTTEYKVEKITIAPMFIPGGELPEGVRGVSSVEYVMVNSNRVGNVTLYGDYGAGTASNLYPDGRLVFNVALPTASPDTFWSGNLATGISFCRTFLMSRKMYNGRNASEDILTNWINKGQSTGSIFVQIEPASGNERKLNR